MTFPRVGTWPSMRALERRVASVLLLVLVLALLPAPALAHGHLQASAPGAGARLTTAPTEIRLTFSESPALAVSSVRLARADGTRVPLGDLGTAAGAPRVVVVPVRGPLIAGAYTVTWQIVGDDGHPTRGRFAFTFAPGAPRGAPAATIPSATAPAAASRPPAAEPPTVELPETGFGPESPLYAAIRWVEYVGLLIALGAVVFRSVVLRFLAGARPASASLLPALRAGAARLGFGATLLVAVAAVLRLVAQWYALHTPPLGAMVLHTVWGAGWLVQAAGVLVAAPGFAAARRPGASRGAWTLAALGTAALAVSPGLSGHAASAPRWTALTVVADVAHIVGAGGWLGSLVVLVAVGIPAARRLAPDARGPALAELVHAFSPTALLFAGVVALTGVFATWVHVGSIPALWQTAYGRTLLLKLAFLAVVAAIGAYNWRRVRPTLAPPTGAARLRRSATAELAVGLLVLATTAVLVAMPTAVDLSATSQDPHGATP